MPTLVHFMQVHLYVLLNTPCMWKWELRHNEISKSLARQKKRNELPPYDVWVPEAIQDAIAAGEVVAQEEIEYSRGPHISANFYKSCWHKGCHYRISSADEWAPVTFNSGISNASFIDSVTNKRDRNPRRTKLKYYGILEDIIELAYDSGIKVVLFRGDWYQTTIGDHDQVTQKVDECGFTKVKTTMKENSEPWMSPEFVGQVFYFQDPTDPSWSWVVDVEGRGCRNMEVHEYESDDEPTIERLLKVQNDQRGSMLGTSTRMEEGDVDDEIINRLMESNGSVNAFHFITGAEVADYVSEYSEGHSSGGADVIGGASSDDESTNAVNDDDGGVDADGAVEANIDSE